MVSSIEPSLLTEPRLVVDQSASMTETTHEALITARGGALVGRLEELGHSRARAVLDAVGSSAGRNLPVRLRLIASGGEALLEIERSARVLRTQATIRDPAGRELGRVRQSLKSPEQWTIEVDGHVVGTVKRETIRSIKYVISDTSGLDLARVTKRLKGAMRAAVSRSDSYDVVVLQRVRQPSHRLVLAAALTIDVEVGRTRSGRMVPGLGYPHRTPTSRRGG